jgi:hypothetical protein
MTKRRVTADGSDVRFANFSKDALREGTFAFLTSDPSGSGANCPRCERKYENELSGGDDHGA